MCATFLNIKVCGVHSDWCAVKGLSWLCFSGVQSPFLPSFRLLVWRIQANTSPSMGCAHTLSSMENWCVLPIPLKCNACYLRKKWQQNYGRNRLNAQGKMLSYSELYDCTVMVAAVSCTGYSWSEHLLSNHVAYKAKISVFLVYEGMKLKLWTVITYSTWRMVHCHNS